MSEPRLDTQTIFNMCMSLHGRLDTLWQRLLYAHAAIVGVMVFFSTTPETFFISRVLVFLFYTVNLLISVVAMIESYRGLQAGLTDIRAREREGEPSHFENWLTSLDYSAHPRRRIMLFGLVWLLIGYLLFARFIHGGAEITLS